MFNKDKIQIISLERANTLKGRIDNHMRIIKKIKRGDRLEFYPSDECFLSALNDSVNPLWNKRMRKVIVEALQKELTLIQKEFNSVVKESK